MLADCLALFVKIWINSTFCNVRQLKEKSNLHMLKLSGFVVCTSSQGEGYKITRRVFVALQQFFCKRERSFTVLHSLNSTTFFKFTKKILILFFPLSGCVWQNYCSARQQNYIFISALARSWWSLKKQVCKRRNY